MKRLGIIAAWVVATLVTGAVAWSAVNLAGDQVADRPVLPLSSAEVDALPTATSPPSSAGAATPTPPTTTTLPAATSTTSAATPPTSSPANSTTAPPPTTPSSTQAGSTTSTTQSPATTTTVAATRVSVHHTIGGVVSIQAGPGEVTLLSASPNAGFSVAVESYGPGEVEVEFESSDHESKLRARWDGGLVVEVDEKPDESDN